jgi:hypothetical protein
MVQLKATHAGHPDVQKQQVVFARTKFCKRLLRIVVCVYLKAVSLKPNLECRRDVWLVVHNHYFLGQSSSAG